MLPVTHPDVTAAFIDAAAANCHAGRRAAVAQV
jgi:hypothetical protein